MVRALLRIVFCWLALGLVWLLVYSVGWSVLELFTSPYFTGTDRGIGVLSHRISATGQASGDKRSEETISVSFTAESPKFLVFSSRYSSRYTELEYRSFHGIYVGSEFMETKRETLINLMTMRCVVDGESWQLSEENFADFFAKVRTPSSDEAAAAIFSLLQKARSGELPVSGRIGSWWPAPFGGRLQNYSSGVYFSIPALIWLVAWAVGSAIYVRRHIRVGRELELASGG